MSPLAIFLLASTPQQIGTVETANQLAENLVALFNAGDAEGIRSLADPEFFTSVPAERLTGLVRQVHDRGTFSRPQLVLDLGEQRHYRVTMSHEGQPNRPIVLVLGATPGKKFFSLNFIPEGPPGPKLRTDNPQKNEWDRAVQAAVERFVGPKGPVGISIAIRKGNRQAFYDYGEAKSRLLPTRRTIFEIGSITKTMTGLLVGQAISDGKLSLDQDIRKYLPGTYPNLEFEGTPVLLRNLVTHTSALPPNPPGIPDDGKADAYEKYNHAQLLSDLAVLKLPRRPGADFQYSNMGAGLVGIALEKTYGLPYESLLRRFILTPAKMKRTGIALTPAMDAAYATPHDATGAPTERWTVNGIEAAGAVRSCAEDMLRYAALNLNEKNPAIAQAHQTQSAPGQKPFGIFWLKGESRTAGTYLDHEGGTGGFTSHILLMPCEKLAVVILTNSGDQQVRPVANEIALRILKTKEPSR